MGPDRSAVQRVPAPTPEPAPPKRAATWRDHEAVRALLVDPWTYTTGAVVLALLNVALVAAIGKGWSVTTSLAYWGAWIWQGLGGDPHSWSYFAEVKPAFNGKDFGFFRDPSSLTNLGIVVGAFLAALLANQFRLKRLKSRRQIAAAILGGLFMGVGARFAFGCNIGDLFTGVPNLSLHGWVFLVSIFAGAAVGSKLLVRWFV